MQPPIRLRDYQRECLTVIFDRYKAGARRQLICLPTGTGKTVIFAQFPSFFRMKRRMLILAHRAELLYQAREKLVAANPVLTVEIEQAGLNASKDSDVVVASVPTLGRRGSRRLSSLNPDEFSIIVIDEAHHATADTYRQSTLLYTQMIGRGTRPHPGKSDVTVVDVVDNSSKHRLVTLPSLFGLAENFNLKGRTTSEVERAIRWVEVNRPWVKTDLATDLDDLRLRCTRIDLLDLRLPDDLLGATRLAWAAVGRSCYRLGLGQGEFLTCAQTVLDRWEVVLRSPHPEVDGNVIASAHRLETALAEADHFISQTRPRALGLADLQAHCRREPATEKQFERLKRAHLQFPPRISRGQASHLIAMLSHGSQ